MAHSVSQHLRIDIAEYDELIRRFIPGYEAMVDRATAMVASIGPAVVLDLGSGTGALAERLLDRTETTVVELWDVDPEMLAVARGRLGRFGDRARFVEGSFYDPLPPADGIMASLSLHHIPTLAAKGELYRRIAAALRPGGWFVNADVTIPAEAPRHAKVYREWADHLVASGIEERRAWGHFEEWSGEDRYFSRDEELTLIAAAGLEPSSPFQLGPATITAGRKA